MYHCINKGQIRGTSYVGGIAGWGDASKTDIINCFNKGNIGSDSASISGGIASMGNVSYSYNMGNVTGTVEIFGISSRSPIEHCYNLGNISGTEACGIVLSGTVNYCYNLGNVTGQSKAYGITNLKNATSINECYNTGNIIGTEAYEIAEYGMTNCYYLKKETNAGIGGSDGTQAQEMTEEQRKAITIDVEGIVNKLNEKVKENNAVEGNDKYCTWILDENNNPTFKTDKQYDFTIDGSTPIFHF